ncbi:MAG: ROK family transcriptional regulator, partial [Spirochaetales bacterium]|nr:ROK family transcriptional regulator [Spirochaetales bacterium]
NNFDRTSKPEIAQALGLSLPTVQQNIRELIHMGLVREAGTFDSTGGRKALAVTSVKESHWALGIDITGNHLGFVLTDLSGRTLIHERIKLRFENSTAYYRELGKRIDDFREQHGRRSSRFLGYGISVPGIIDRSGTTLLYSHALGLRDLPCREISDFLDGTSFFINDANAAGFAETYRDDERDDAVYLFLSRSVGGALLQNRRLPAGNDPLGETIYTGDNNRSSEFGHMTLYPDGIRCYCGKLGCADSYCSSRVLATEEGEELISFFERLADGESRAEAVWAGYLKNLAIVVNNLRMVYDTKVIIGGEVGRYIGPYMKDLETLAARRNTFDEEGSYLTACRHKVESSALGAALIMIERFITGI